jgi:hypothetical protein
MRRIATTDGAPGSRRQDDPTARTDGGDQVEQHGTGEADHRADGEEDACAANCNSLKPAARIGSLSLVGPVLGELHQQKSTRSARLPARI